MADMTGWPTDGAEGSVSSEARWRKMARIWAPSGVITGLVPTLGSGVINVTAGSAWLDGHYAETTGSASESNSANGLLVARFTAATNEFELVYRDGATTPTQTDATWELPIARMTAGALTDVRPIAVGALPNTTVRYTANGTFVKANYPGLRAVRIRLVGGGGGGSGNGNGNGTGGPGGGGGGYAEKVVLAAALAASETVTVGSAGAASSSFVVGGDGGPSSFGAHCAAGGGSGGTVGGFGGPSGTGTTGDLLIAGGYGGSTSDQVTTTSNTAGGHGGDSQLGTGGRGGAVRAADVNGTNGNAYGGGGGGGHRTTAPAAGGNGAAGIVIVELFH